VKVLLISSSSGSHGGGEFYLVLLAQGLVDLGCEVTVLMSDGSHMDGLNDMLSSSCAVERMPLINTYHRKTRVLGSVFDQSQIHRIYERIVQLAPDVVHINKQCVDDGLGILIASDRTQLPCVVTVHVTRTMSELRAIAGRLRDWLSRRVLRGSGIHFVAVSDRCRNELQAVLGADETVTAIANGTTPAATDARHKLRENWNLDLDQIVLGTVARIEEQKNPLFLVRVVAALPDHVHLVWIGDGRLRQQLEAEIVRYSLQDRFHLLGWQDQAKDQMCGFDVFVLPSLYEGFPFAILEAMSAGLPCVVSDVDGNGESVLHEKTGYVLPVSDTEQWVNSLQTLINTRNKRAEFGCAGFDRFQQEFDVSVMARRTMAVYEKVRGVNRVPSA